MSDSCCQLKVSPSVHSTPFYFTLSAAGLVWAASFFESAGEPSAPSTAGAPCKNALNLGHQYFAYSGDRRHYHELVRLNKLAAPPPLQRSERRCCCVAPLKLTPAVAQMHWRHMFVCGACIG